MTRGEFLRSIPDIIDHKTWGYGELEIVVDQPIEKGVCYRHPNKTASFGTYGSSWQEVYNDLYEFLKKEG